MRNRDRWSGIHESSTTFHLGVSELLKQLYKINLEEEKEKGEKEEEGNEECGIEKERNEERGMEEGKYKAKNI